MPNKKMQPIAVQIARVRKQFSNPDIRQCAVCGQSFNALDARQLNHHAQSGPQQPMAEGAT